MTHPHLEGLNADMDVMRDVYMSPKQRSAYNRILAQALAALPGGGVDAGALFERAYAKGYRAALGAAAAECRRIGEALDGGGNTYVRYADAIKCASAVSGLRVPEISPTPNPHEADPS